MDLEKIKSNLQTPIAIVGLGITGKSVYDLLLAMGYQSCDILLFDQNEISTDVLKIINSSTELMLKKPKTLIVSPGVPLKTKWISDLRNSGIRILSELSLASFFLTSERVIAVTGSLGKSTTVSLLKHALENSNITHFVGGNLGLPLANYARELVEKRREPAAWVCLELSSYQLENFPELNSDLAAITYLAPNHLERYDTLEEYYKTKWNLLSHTKGSVLCNSRGGDLKMWAESHPTNHNPIWIDRNSDCIEKFALKNPALLGSHNLDNLALAASLAEAAGWPQLCIESMAKFPGLPHRVENLGVHNGVRFINDSKATTIESVMTAVESTLESVPEKNILHLLLGGRDKNLPWQNLKALKDQPKMKLYFFGECRLVIREKSSLEGAQFQSLKEAISAAKNSARAGDSILLSPGGTSLDEFKNFEVRGNFFKEQIRK